MIQTYTGKFINPFADENEDCGPIVLMDIAHALSNLCRFNGHVKRFYSVGEHSLYVSTLLAHHEPATQAWGLLHDAAEAYLGDMVRPLKQRMPEYKVIEDRMLQRIAKRFGLAWPIPDVVFDADEIMLATEFRDLMPTLPQSPLKMPPFPVVIPYHIGSPEVIRKLFMTRAAGLGLT